MNEKAKVVSLKDEIVVFDEQIKVRITAVKTEIVGFDEQIRTEVEEIQQRIDVAQSKVLKVSSSLQELKQALTYQTLAALHQAKNNMTTLGEKLMKLSSDKNPHHETVESLNKEGEVAIDYKALDNMIKLLAHQEFLLKLLVDKNSFVRKNIISKTIPFLNKRIAFYTESLNLPHIVLFQPDMSCKISQLGRELDHGNLSAGEQLKLNLSLCFAFRDVLTYLHAKVNVLFTDEVDAGSISGPDVDSLIKLLKSKAWDDAIGIFIISHRPEFEDRCDRNLVVRKEKGFSVLIDQPDA